MASPCGEGENLFLEDTQPTLTSALKNESEVIYFKLIQLCNFHLPKKKQKGPNSLLRDRRLGRIQLDKAIGGGKIAEALHFLLKKRIKNKNSIFFLRKDMW